MKSITLTTKHIDKLNKMCEILFPGREIYITYSDIESLPIEEGDLHCGEALKFIWMLDRRKDGYVIWHWFEFCCTILLEDLAVSQFNGITDDVIFEQTKLDYWKAISLDEVHPVDWLYDFYQSIPKGQ